VTGPEFDPLVYAEDFRHAWAALPAAEHAQLVAGIRQLARDGAGIGGPACCGGIWDEEGAPTGWHRPWCTEGAIRFRGPANNP
jgi:hypothetical protein